MVNKNYKDRLMPYLRQDVVHQTRSKVIVH